MPMPDGIAVAWERATRHSTRSGDPRAARRVLVRSRKQPWSQRTLGALVVPDSTHPDRARRCCLDRGPSVLVDGLIGFLRAVQHHHAGRSRTVGLDGPRIAANLAHETGIMR